jgi:hypothetical protein
MRTWIHDKLPNTMELWGKMRIQNGGDSVRSTMASGKWLNERDSSYVQVRGLFIDQIYWTDEPQYEVTIEGMNWHSGAPLTHTMVFYGQLGNILVCELPDDNIFRCLRGKRACLLS